MECYCFSGLVWSGFSFLPNTPVIAFSHKCRCCLYLRLPVPPFPRHGCKQAKRQEALYDMVYVERLPDEQQMSSGLFLPTNKEPKMHVCKVEHRHACVKSRPHMPSGSRNFAQELNRGSLKGRQRMARLPRQYARSPMVSCSSMIYCSWLVTAAFFSFFSCHIFSAAKLERLRQPQTGPAKVIRYLYIFERLAPRHSRRSGLR